MFGYIKSFINYFFSYNSTEEYDNEMENYLAEELIKLDLEQEKFEEVADTQLIPKTSDCFQRTGVITYISEDSQHVLIDGMFYFDITACSIRLNINDKVVYLCYKNSIESLVVVRILENCGEHWGDFDVDVDETSFKVIEHVIIGEVDFRQDRMVIIKDSDLKFNLDDVSATFIPVQGDLLELLCRVQFDEENPMAISSNTVLEVISFRPLRSKTLSAVITQWNGEHGICGKTYFFDKQCNIFGKPQVGAKADIEAVESNQGACPWRVIKMDITQNEKSFDISPIVDDDIEQRSLETEKFYNIEVTYPLKFNNVKFYENPRITLTITNRSQQLLTMYKCILLCKRIDSQVDISPTLPNTTKLYPNRKFRLTLTCHPKFYGKSKEHLIITFRGFKVERLIEINILSDIILTNPSADNNCVLNNNPDMIEIMKKMRYGPDKSHVPGVRLTKAPNFVSVKIGLYNIPEKVWSAVLGPAHEHISELKEILHRIESYFPCLLQNLNITNYIDRWHTLLYLEEIQATINMKAFNIPSTFLVKYQEYLGIEIKKLAERRPSIIIGDKVVVTDIWDIKTPSYEGFVHMIRGDLLLIKFHPRFHESYQGSDVSVEFHFNRMTLRKAHHVINLAISTLGPNVLFPSRVLTRPPQIPLEKTKNIRWFNETLNTRQKAAVTNILLGECRPMPYCIYGPPGTGKTVTVVETLLQILTLLPDSRILVATPSNSAANLITERLIQYKNQFSSSVIRLIANYMVDSENIPDIIKPFCATLNIARENTARPTHITTQDGINVNVPASYVGRYRVTIGTCHCLGTLAQMELPKGHFTHIIVDEAGQAIEPEIMIPMTFVDKENGQIIVAGDPMQLGPVVLSKYCIEYGMDESYLERILDTFPYQKDFAAFENGFNHKLVTQLTDNYRSLQEVLTLPSEMFYEATLVAKIDRSTPFIPKILDVVSEIYELTDDPKTGGIFVHGIKGNNARAVDSPSWYNPEEASMVALTICKLYRQNITPDEIGIITPYIAQIKHLRRLFDHMNLQLPKIGTVEEFQGQERPLIIISTVRSTEALVAVDQKHSLGFVKSPKRLNVALTRAQVAVLLFCDPQLLMTDPLWNRVINTAIKENKYKGCDVCHEKNNELCEINEMT